jgi:hypothetical protein
MKERIVTNLTPHTVEDESILAIGAPDPCKTSVQIYTTTKCHKENTVYFHEQTSGPHSKKLLKRITCPLYVTTVCMLLQPQTMHKTA